MSSNPDPTKQVNKVVFLFFFLIPCTHPSLFFNNSLIDHAATQKHLGLTLDQKLTFQCYINEIIAKAMKGIGLL